MEIKELLDVLSVAAALKENTRHAWMPSGRQESVAEHTFRLCVMAYFLKDEFKEADMDKVIRMCLFHDFGEAFTGDIPTFEKTEEDETKEESVLNTWVATLPDRFRDELGALFLEMNEMQTTEAKLYKALDKMEAVITHNECDIDTWLPLEYDLQITYGEKEVAFSEYTKKLKAAANDITREKIRKHQMKMQDIKEIKDIKDIRV